MKGRRARYSRVAALFCSLAFSPLFFSFLDTPGRWGISVLSPVYGEEDLDEKFYNDYLDSLPSEKRERKGLLESNLIRVAGKAIPRKDPEFGPEYVKNLSEKNLSFKRVTVDSKFVRGVFHEMPYLKPTPYMWVLQTGRYIIFITFPVDPARYIIDENQAMTVVKMESKPSH